MSVLGVDACKDGWIGIRLHGDSPPAAFCEAEIASLVAAAGDVSIVAVDIPIGLPKTQARAAEALARRAVGPRRASSVFTTGPRAALEAPTHAEATALSKQLCGYGISVQAYALAPKILEVDSWLTGTSQRVIEVHPEVCFATLAKTFLPDPKSIWAGIERRRQLLADAGIVLSGDLGLSGRRVGIDDVLDAAAAASTATRVERNEHRCLPDPPELIDGKPVAIWA